MILELLEKKLEPYDHDITQEGVTWYIRLGDIVLALGWRTIMEAESPTYDIHHTEECLQGQKAFYEFQEFIESFGGYVPTPTCDCPRDKIPPNPEKHADLLFNHLLNKYHSSRGKVK